MGDDDYEQAPGWAIRLEAKVDVALATHRADLDSHARRLTEVETGLRRLEDDPRVAPETITDHETRLREQEKRAVVSPRTLAATVAGVLGALGALSPFIDRLYS